MPSKKQVKSLSQACLLVVTSQLANYDPKVKDDEVNSSNHDEEKTVTIKRITPFDQWPTHFVEQVIEALKTRGLLNIKHYDLLKMTRKLSLDLISRGIEDTNSFFHLLQLAEDCCTEITVLNFGLFKMHLMGRALFYQKFLPQFKNLEVLSVAYSSRNFDDSCLHLIGTHCTSLRELDVRGCCVTNSGIEGLCGMPAK